MKITIVVLLVVLGLVIVGTLVAGPRLELGFGGGESKPKGTAVRLQVAEEQPLIEFVSAPGVIEPHTQVHLSSEVSARIVALPVREGDLVRKGDVVCRLDDEDLTAALESSVARRDGEDFRLRSEQARLEGANSTLSFARKQLERDQTLFESGDVSRKALDDSIERMRDLESQVDAANYTISVLESALISAKANIDQATDMLEKTVVNAPMDGVVTAVYMEVGEQVLGTFNNLGSRIVTIADLDRMLLIAEVAESDIAAVKLGQTAKIHINAYPDEVFSGTVTQIALQRSMSNDGSGVFNVEVEIDLQGRRIYSGLAANVDIEITQHHGVRVESQAVVDRLIDDLPDAARRDPLVDRSKRTAAVVYRLVDNEAVCTPVKTGPSDLTHTLVLEGLDVGDQVVVGPYKVLEKIKEGEAYHDEALDLKEEEDEEEAEDGEAATDTEAADTEPATVEAEQSQPQ